MHCYRYVTPALKGPWRRSAEEALRAALAAGQAFRQGGSILLCDFAKMQTQPAYRCLGECEISRDAAGRELEHLQKQASRCRSAASATLDVRTRQTLLGVAEEYEQRVEASKSVGRRATETRWRKADERMPDPLRASDVLERNRPERTSRAIHNSSWEELRWRSEQHDIDQARIGILKRVARGLPINVLERKLIAGHLPPGF